MTNEELLLNKAKTVIFSETRKTLPGTGNLEISIEAHGGVEYFEQALQLPEVQHALRAKNITASLRVIDPLATVKQYILNNLRTAPQNAEVVFQVLEVNKDLHFIALGLPEVREVVNARQLTIKSQVLDKHGRTKPDIVIATYDAIAKGRIDNL